MIVHIQGPKVTRISTVLAKNRFEHSLDSGVPCRFGSLFVDADHVKRKAKSKNDEIHFVKKFYFVSVWSKFVPKCVTVCVDD